MEPGQPWHVKEPVFLGTGDLGVHPCTHPDSKKDPAVAAKAEGLLLVWGKDGVFCGDRGVRLRYR